MGKPISNTFAAEGAPFQRRTQTAAQVDQIDQSIGNGFQYHQWDAAYLNELAIAGYDTNDQLRVGNSVVNPTRSQVTVHIYPNASLATTAFFVNPTPNNIYITGIKAVLTTAGTVAGATAKVTHEALSGSLQQAAGTGKTVLSGTFDVTATAQTVQAGTLVANYQLATRNVSVLNATPGTGVIVLAPGDSLSFVKTGTWTTAVGLTITLSIAPGSKYHFVSYYCGPAGTAVTRSLLTANRSRTLLYGAALWQVKEATASTLTADIFKDASGTAPGAGTSMLASTVNLKGTALTYTQLALSATAANLALAASDSVAVKISASTTELPGMLVTLAFDGKMGEVQIDYNSINSTVGTNEEFWIADGDYEVLDFAGKWSTVGGAGSLALLTGDSGTSTPGSGGVALQTDNSSTGFDLTGTINVPVWATLPAVHLRFVKSGDRLGIKNAGTLGSLAGLQLSVRLRRM